MKKIIRCICVLLICATFLQKAYAIQFLPLTEQEAQMNKLTNTILQHIRDNDQKMTNIITKRIKNILKTKTVTKEIQEILQWLESRLKNQRWNVIVYTKNGKNFASIDFYSYPTQVWWGQRIRPHINKSKKRRIYPIADNAVYSIIGQLDKQGNYTRISDLNTIFIEFDSLNKRINISCSEHKYINPHTNNVRTGSTYMGFCPIKSSKKSEKEPNIYIISFNEKGEISQIKEPYSP